MMVQIDLERVERELHEARMDARRHGHDWDVADVMAVLRNQPQENS